MEMRCVLLLLAFALGLCAQTKMGVDQLRSFIQSSRQLGHPDKTVAQFLKQVQLTHRLDARTIEELQGLGAGPRTLEALRGLSEQAKSLPLPPPPPAKVPALTIPPPDSIEQKRILGQVTEYALDYARRLPNFICTQVTRRFVDPSGMEFWQRQDVVTAKLSYFDQKEDYKVVLVNNQVVDTTLDRLGGATSTGEFGTMLKQIFEPQSEARFEWDRWATLRGKRMHVFSYRVPQSRSQWRIVFERSQSVVPGYRGFIYVDRDTLAIMRITLEAEDMPVTFPVQRASTMLDYDFMKIADDEHVLPLRAMVLMRSGKMLIKNEAEFRLYRKFGAEATITFTPDPLTEDQIKELPK